MVTKWFLILINDIETWIPEFQYNGEEIIKTGFSHQTVDIIKNGGGQIWEDSD